MIFGAHVIVYSKDSTADRAFFRDVLGWLIFELPPAEAAVHPDEGNDRHELYFNQAPATVPVRGGLMSQKDFWFFYRVQLQ